MIDNFTMYLTSNNYFSPLSALLILILIYLIYHVEEVYLCLYDVGADSGVITIADYREIYFPLFSIVLRGARAQDSNYGKFDFPKLFYKGVIK
jgi:hypothetical protein